MDTEPSEEARELARKLAAIRGPALEAVMLDDLDSVLRDDRKATRVFRGPSSVPPEQEKEESGDMGVQVGDNTINNHYSASAGGKSQTLKNLITAAAIGVAAIGGGGIGVGVPWLLGAFAPPAAEVSADQDTQYELRIGAE